MRIQTHDILFKSIDFVSLIEFKFELVTDLIKMASSSALDQYISSFE